MADILKDIALQTAIIEALVTENRLLKAEIANLRRRIGQNMDTSSTAKSETGSENDFSSTPESKSGLNNDISSILKSVSGLTNDFLSTVGNEIGSENDFSSTIKSVNGLTSVTSSTPKNESGLTTPVLALPEYISPELHHKVANVVSASGFSNMRRRYFINAAKLLIHFHNNSPSAYGALCKLTGLSHGGLSKNLTSMRKKGLIKNVAFQRYAPTELGRSILLKALNS
jgi:hypothetical protein